MRIGVIAEDKSDVDVIREITLGLLKPGKIGFRSFVGNGCGKLRRKCGSWAGTLVKQGCPFVVVVHDLDRSEEESLRRHLTQAIQPARAALSVILIPKHEIEAWLLCDATAIAAAFRETKKVKLPGTPEHLPDPKRTLEELVWTKYRKTYLNTVHNALVARHINSALLKKCTSFALHPPFVAKVRERL